MSTCGSFASDAIRKTHGASFEHFHVTFFVFLDFCR